MTLADPYALNEDGTAVDPTAFQGALRADAAKLALVNKEPEDRRGILLGDDMPAFQALLQDAVKVIVIPCNASANHLCYPRRDLPDLEVS